MEFSSASLSIRSISFLTGTVLVVICAILVRYKRAKSPSTPGYRKIRSRWPRNDDEREYDDIDADDDDGNIAQSPRRLRSGFHSFGFDEEIVAAEQERFLDPVLVEDSKLIGGSPKHLPPPRGPTGTTLTFRVYAPPSLDKEIPKVDLVGAIDFLKTGKVRTFVPLGAKRLLIINFRDMTLEMYMPKQGKNKRSRAKELQQPTAFSPDGSIQTINTHGNIHYEKHGLKVSGINISTKRLAPMEGLGTKLRESEGSSDWDPDCFETKPHICHPLNELISVSALPPSYSGTIEILYKSVHFGMKENSVTKSSNQKPKQGKSQEAAFSKQPRLKKGDKSMKNLRSITRMNSKESSNSVADYSAESENNELEKWLGDFDINNLTEQHDPKNSNSFPSVTYPDDDDGRVDYAEPTVLADDGFAAVAVGLSDHVSSRNLPSRSPSATRTLTNCQDSDDNIKETEMSPANCREEFVFCNPRDAAEFQRVVLALRTSGREITHLYETLEAIQATSEAHFPELLNPLGEIESRKKVKQAQKENKRKKSVPLIPKFVPAGVALDDAWRSLGDLPPIRQGLTRLHRYSTNDIGNDDDIIAEAGGSTPYNSDQPAATENKSEASDGMAENEETQIRRRLARYYRERREILGIVDFFSLFVPPLPPNSNIIPRYASCAASDLYVFDGLSEESSSGIESIESYSQRLRIASALTRLVSRSALYVKAYALAKIVVRDGWHLHKGNHESSCETSATSPSDEFSTHIDTAEKKTSTPTSEESKSVARMNKTRLVFDTNRQNWLHDSGVRNESYEPTVGKDLTTLVSSGNSSCPEKPNVWSSPYQAYSLVGWHAFKLPDPSDNRAKHWLRPDVDPVESIPSLKDVIEKYPDSHFIVFSHFRKGVAVFSLYVRTLPYGVDASFDKTMNRFIKSPSEERNSVLQCAWHLCPGQNWSSLTKRAARTFVISLCHIWMRGKVIMPFSLDRKGKMERLSFPCILMSKLARCKHFGGSMRTREGMPKNYVSFSMLASVENAPSMMTKILIQSMQSSRLGIFKTCVVDIQLVLRARFGDEYPERVLTALRFVHVDLNEVANPPDFCEHSSQNSTCEAEEESLSQHVVKATGWLTRLLRFRREEKAAAVINSKADMSISDRTNELYSSSIDALYSILDGITVSCPKKTGSCLCDSEDGNTMMRKSVLDEYTRADIERYIIACNNDLRDTAVRMVESAAWRCATFPVDTRTCKIELSSGQFFQQGKDKEKNPVFYFRNLLPSIWRHDIDATVFALLHLLESFLRPKPRTKATIIILLCVENLSDYLDKKNTSNKRKEQYHVHSNLQLVHRLTRILSRHYPERLSKALFVTSGGWAKTLVSSRIKSHVESPITRSRIHVLNSLEDLKKYVNRSELVSFAGGKADVCPSAYQLAKTATQCN